MRQLSLIALAAAAAALAACSAEPKPAPRMAAAGTMASDASPRPATTGPAPVRRDVTTPTSGSIHIDDKILRACGNLPTAHFAFDSAAVAPEAAAVLDALGRCFTTGALAGRSMLLTGHTDPRGELEYNMALGQRRAGSVATYLAGRGMAKAHLSSTSHGELDATGTDEEGWARDRKVDVTLAE